MRSLLAAFLVLSCASALAQRMPARAYDGTDAPAFALRAPGAAAASHVALPAEKALPAEPPRAKRLGTVRAVAPSPRAAQWTAVEGGWLARFVLESPGAQGLRARFSLPADGAGMEVAVRGSDGRVEGFDNAGAIAWTPYTAGSLQEVEIFTRVRPTEAPEVEAIVHFDTAPGAKVAAGTCSPDVACSSGDAALDAAIAQRRNSVVLVNFVDGTLALSCTGTLINTEKAPTPFVVTANHCIPTAALAASVTTIWFDEAAACGEAALNPGQRQVAGGAQLVFTSPGADSTLLQLNRDPPAGAVFAAWDATPLADGSDVVSISHPQGDVKKYALGKQAGQLLVRGYPQDMYGVTFSRGVTESGSSGSGLFTLSNGSLVMRGILSGSTLRTGAELSCTNADVEEALFGRMEIFAPQIARYVSAAPFTQPDDYGNRIADAQRIFFNTSAVPSETSYGGRIDYAGDLDVFRVDIAQGGGTLTVRTTGAIDTIGSLLDSTGRTIKNVDDAEAASKQFGITRTLTAGTYYLVVGHHEAQGTGAYTLTGSISTVTDNYTDLWWNANESGWGLNLNHQGQTLFGTLFTFDRNGRAMWLVMPSATKQPAGYWQGALYRTTGPAFDATPFTAAQLTQVGTMRITFSSAKAATISYSVDGVTVNKAISRQVFATGAPLCTWSSFDRSLTTNFQDLWWNPQEPGWGLNIAHQGNILFATLFTYESDGQGLWLVMSDGERIADGLYIGKLYSVTGPPFNTTPWTPVTVTDSGTMTIQFTRGNAGTLTYTHNGILVVKSIQRQVFGAPATECFAPGDG